MRVILSSKQYKYYTEHTAGNKTILQIAIDNKVSCSTVCRTIALAKRKILKYYENQMKG